MGRQRDPEVTQRIERVVEAWNQGDKLIRQIAADMGLAEGTAAGLLRKARDRGIVVRKGTAPRNPRTTKRRDAVVRAFNRGETQLEIGERFGITRGAVGRLIAEARAMGMRVISYTKGETSQRQKAAEKANRQRSMTNEPATAAPAE